jgi:flavin-dependent dehydrogenase
MRSHLDAWFCAQASRAGAEIRDRCALLGLTPVEGGLEARTTRGTIRARFLVAADGAASRTARWAGWEPNPSNIPGLEWEIPVPRAVLDQHAGVARFDLGVTRRGYAWVFPKREHLSVGILETRRGARDLRAQLERYLRRVGIGPFFGEEQHGALIPLAPRPGGAARGRVLLAGDAAGFVDPVTCEGITYAIRSGQLAARALVDAGDASQVCAAYETSIGREILPELQLARRLSRVVFGPARLRTWLFRRVGQSFGELMADIITARRTYRELLESPASYAKLAVRLLRPARGRPGHPA